MWEMDLCTRMSEFVHDTIKVRIYKYVCVLLLALIGFDSFLHCFEETQFRQNSSEMTVLFESVSIVGSRPRNH